MPGSIILLGGLASGICVLFQILHFVGFKHYFCVFLIQHHQVIDPHRQSIVLQGPPAVSTTIIRVSSPALSLGGDGGGANSALTETPPTTPKQGEISEKKQGPLPAVDARAMLWVGFAEMCVAHAVAKVTDSHQGSE